MSSLKLLMILGSVRHGRNVERVAKLVTKSAQKQSLSMVIETMDPQVVDPNCDLNRQPLHFLQNAGKGTWMEKVNETVKTANAFLVLTSEYNGNVPPALLNLMNSIPPPSFRNRPVGIVTYSAGTTGAMRALNIARPYTCELGMLVVPGFVAIPVVHETIDAEGNCSNELVNGNMSKLLRNLEWYSKAINNHHKAGNNFVEP